jgi:hypothetical protein
VADFAGCLLPHQLRLLTLGTFELLEDVFTVASPVQELVVETAGGLFQLPGVHLQEPTGPDALLIPFRLQFFLVREELLLASHEVVDRLLRAVVEH